MAYKIVKLEQGTPEWLGWRQGKITASEIANIVGCGFETPEVTWLRKKGLMPPLEDNRAMARGRMYEPYVRFWCQYHPYAKRWAEQKNGLPFQEITPQCLERTDPGMTWIAASLDGLYEDAKAFLEIKVPSRAVHESIKKMCLDDHVKKYYLQLQWQHLVTGNKMTGHFVSAHGIPDSEEPIPYKDWVNVVDIARMIVDPDPEEQARLIKAGQRFRELLQEKDLPVLELRQIVDEYRQETRPRVTNEDLEVAIKKYAAFKQAADVYKELSEKAKETILDHYRQTKQQDFGPVQVKKITGRKTLSRNKMYAAGIDPDRFMNEGEPIVKVVLENERGDDEKKVKRTNKELSKEEGRDV